MVDESERGIVSGGSGSASATTLDLECCRLAGKPVARKAARRRGLRAVKNRRCLPSNGSGASLVIRPLVMAVPPPLCRDVWETREPAMDRVRQWKRKLLVV